MGLDDLADQDLVDLVENLEAEFQREFIAQEVDADHDRVLIVGLMTSEMTPLQFQDTLLELARLVDTAGEMYYRQYNKSDRAFIPKQ